MQQLNREPDTIQSLQASYDRLYTGWMGSHKNLNQAERMLDLLAVQPGKRLADIGCGLGHGLNQGALRGLKTFGIDVSFVALRKALQENHLLAGVALAAAEALPWPTGSMDYVIILGSLEHFLHLETAVKETARVLKDDGKAAILVPNSHHIRAIYNVYKFGEILPEFQDYERFATRKEWENLFTTNGLQVLSVHKFDTGMSRLHKKGRIVFWYIYNTLFRLFGSRWIPLNLTYSFIFICERRQPNTVCF